MIAEFFAKLVEGWQICPLFWKIVMWIIAIYFVYFWGLCIGGEILFDKLDAWEIERQKKKKTE